MNIVLKSRKQLTSPRNDASDNHVSVQKRLTNSLTPVANTHDSDFIEIPPSNNCIVVRNLQLNDLRESFIGTQTNRDEFQMIGNESAKSDDDDDEQQSDQEESESKDKDTIEAFNGIHNRVSTRLNSKEEFFKRIKSNDIKHGYEEMIKHHPINDAYKVHVGTAAYEEIWLCT